MIYNIVVRAPYKLVNLNASTGSYAFYFTTYFAFHSPQVKTVLLNVAWLRSQSDGSAFSVQTNASFKGKQNCLK